MPDEDVFAWAASLPKHTCEWVKHPTPDEIRERDEKIVWKRIWWMPCLKRRCIVHVGGNFGIVQPYEQCAICDAKKGVQTTYDPTTDAVTFTYGTPGQEWVFDGSRWKHRAGTQAPNELRTAYATTCSAPIALPRSYDIIDPWYPPDASNLADACVFE